MLNKCIDCGAKIEKYEKEINSDSKNIRCDDCKEETLIQFLNSEIQKHLVQIEQLKTKVEELRDKRGKIVLKRQAEGLEAFEKQQAI